jgi:hypothetical protein
MVDYVALKRFFNSLMLRLRTRLFLRFGLLTQVGRRVTETILTLVMSRVPSVLRLSVRVSTTDMDLSSTSLQD